MKAEENLGMRIMLEEIVLEELNREHDVLRNKPQENTGRIKKKNRRNSDKKEKST